MARKLVYFRSFLLIGGLVFFLGFVSLFISSADETLSAPANLQSEIKCVASGPQVVLSWDYDTSASIQKYYVFKNQINGSSIVGIVSPPTSGNKVSWSNNPSVSDEGKKVTYYVEAEDAEGYYSSPSSVTITIPYCPAPTLSLSEGCVGNTVTVNLSWTNSGHVTYFNIFRKIGTGSYTLINQLPGTISFWQDKNLSSNQSYSYYIQAVGEGWELSSTSVTAPAKDCINSTTPSPAPTLSAVTRCVNGTAEIVLQWTPSLHVNYYKLEKSFTKDGVLHSLSSNISSNVSQYEDMGSISGDLGFIAQNVVYTYKIEAIGSNNEVVASNQVSVTFTSNCSSSVQPPSQPTNLSYSSRCQGIYPLIRLSWQPVNGATGYYIFRKDPEATSYHYIAYAKVDSNPNTSLFDYDDSSVLPNKNYSYKIEAVNLGGVSSAAEITNVLVQDKCSSLPAVPVLAPLSSSCDANNNPVVNLKWSQSSMPDPNTGGFEIYQIDASGTKVLIGKINSNNVFTYQDKDDNTPLQSNAVYSYEVEALGAWGQNPTFSNEEAIKVISCPLTAPSQLNFTQSCNNTARVIDLSWSGGNNAKYYQIYESNVAGILGTKVADNLTTRNKEITTFNYGNLYFTVRAVGYDGSTKDSSLLLVSSYDCGPLVNAPTIDFTASQSKCASTSPYLHLVWQEVSNADYYKIFRKQGLNGAEQILTEIDNKSTTSYDDHSVSSGNDYYYRVVAYKNGNSKTSNYIQFSIAWCPPTAPTNLQVAQSCSVGNPVVKLNWQTTPNTKDYAIFRESVPNAITAADSPLAKVTATAYSDSTAQNNQIYYYVVRAEGKDGVSNADSASLKVQTIDCQPPTQVTVFNLESKCEDGDSEVALSWSAVSGSGYYQVYREKGANLDNSAKLIADHLTATSYLDKNVLPGIAYVYGIKACNAGGCSSLFSPVAVGKGISVEWCAPEKPEDFTGSSTSCDGSGHPIVNLTWTKDTSGNVDYYILKRSDGVTLTNNLSGSASSFTDSFATKDVSGNPAPPANNITYTYTLIAVGHSGEQTAQSTFTLKTHNCSLPNTPTIASIQGNCAGPFYYNEIKWQPVLNFSSAGQYYVVKRNGEVLFDSRSLIMDLSMDNIANGKILTDKSLVSNNGELVGSGFSLVTGRFGQALQLTGGGFVCLDGTNCGWNTSNAYFDNSLSQRTVSFWFKAQNVNSQQFLYDEGGSANGLNIYIKNGLLYAGAWSKGNGWYGKWIAASIQADKWYNVTFVFNSNAGFLKLYLNGKLQAQAAAATSITNHIDNDALGGVSQSSLLSNNKIVFTGNYFKGLLDQLSVWRTALTSEQIKELYRGGIIPDFKQCIWDDFAALSSQNYQYTVIAGNTNGEVSASASQTANNLFCQPIINNFFLKEICTGSGENQVTLSWEQPIPENVSSYQIIRKDLDAGTEQILTNDLTSATTTYTDIFSAQDNHYQYEVIVQGKNGSSVKVTQDITLNSCVPLNIPPYLESLQKSCQQFLPIVKLQWQKSSGAVYYKIFRNNKEIYDTRWNTAGYWPLVKDVKDYSENNNNGSLIGFGLHPFQTIAGRTGLNFSGSQFVSIPASQSLDFSQNGTNFTLEAWVYFTGGLSGIIISKENNYLLSLTNQGEIRWAIRGVVVPNDKNNFNNGAWVYKNTGVYVPLNKWTFVTLTYDKTAVKVYVNGELKSSISAVQGYSDYNVYNNEIEIGRREGGIHEYFHGLISQVKMAARPESPTEIQADYNATKNGGNYILANPANISSYVDYAIVTAKSPFYVNKSYAYYVEAFSQTSGLKGNIQTTVFQSPQDVCSSLPIVNESYSLSCSVKGPGDSFPEFKNEWYDFLPGNNVYNFKDYRLLIDNNLVNIDPYFFNYNKGDQKWGKAKLDIKFDLLLFNSLAGNHQAKLQAENLKYGKFFSDPININVPDCTSPAAVTNFAIKSECKNGKPAELLSWSKDKTGYTNNYYIEREDLAINNQPSGLTYQADEYKSINWNIYNQGLAYAQGKFYSVNSGGGINFIKDNLGYFHLGAAPKYIRGLTWDTKNNCFWLVGKNNLNDPYRIYKLNSSLTKVLASFLVSSDNTDPRGIATDGSHLFVTDFNGLIIEYNLNGQEIKKMDVAALINRTTHLVGIAYWQNYLYVGTSNAPDETYKDYIYIIDPTSSQGGFSLQAKINLYPNFPLWWSSGGWGVSGIATDGHYLYVTGHRYTSISLKKYALEKNANKEIWLAVPATDYTNATSTINYLDDYNLTLSGNYKYRIIAHGNYGSYNYSPWVTVIAQAQCYNAPLLTNISLVAPKCSLSGQSYIEIKWQAMPENNYTDDYILMRQNQDNSEIKRGEIPDSDFGIKIFSFSNTSYHVICHSQEVNSQLKFTCDDYTVQPGKAYKYYLIAEGLGGQTASTLTPSYSLAAYDCSAPPGKPSLTASSGCVSGQFQPKGILRWPRTKNTYQYNLYRFCQQSSFSNFHNVAVIDNSYPFSGAQYVSSTDSLIYEDKTIPSNLKAGTKCSYYLKAIGPNGEATSSVVSFNISNCGNTPAPPKDLKLSKIKCNSVTLEWQDTTPIGYAGTGPGTAAEFEFDIYRAEGSHCSNFKKVAKKNSSNPGEISYTDNNGIHEQQTYCWKVVAVNPAGETPSQIIKTTTPKCPPGAFELQAKLAGCGKVVLQWREAENYLGKENASAYEIYRGDSPTNFQLITTTPACEGKSSCSIGYDASTKTYTYLDHYDKINPNRPFPPGKSFYYLVKALPLTPLAPTQSTNSSLLKVVPCPALPTWKQVAP